MKRLASLFVVASFAIAPDLSAQEANAEAGQQVVVDICISGATPAGLNAAVAGQGEGKTVV